MELLSGQLLQDRLERGPAMGEIELLELATSILEVLDAAHSRGVVHRDLKPDNLFLGATRAPTPRGTGSKILDFGLEYERRNGDLAANFSRFRLATRGNPRSRRQAGCDCPDGLLASFDPR